MSSKTPWLSRRNVLRGAGVALALPWLESLAPRAARGVPLAPRRSFVAMSFPLGAADYWKPQATGSGDAWKLSPILEPLAPVKEYVNVLANVGNYGPFGGHVEPSCSNLTGALLSCVKPTKDSADSAVGGVSVDQVIAKSIGTAKLDSLQVGLSTQDSFTDGLLPPFSRSISWRSPTEPLYKLVSPRAVFDRLVTAGGIVRTPYTRGPADKSVLDYVLAHATTVRAQAGKSDRLLMDQFMTSVRELEESIASVPAGPAPDAPAAPSCATPPRPSANYAVGDVPSDYSRDTHADLMIDLVVMALQCDATRVVSFMLDDSRSEFEYSFLKERDFTPSGSMPAPGAARVGSPFQAHFSGDPTNKGFATINWWYVSKLARLCQKLQAIPDGAGNLLDSATIWFGSEMNNHHDGLDLPILTVGKGGGALRTNQFIDFAQTPRQTERLANLYLTFLRNVFGLPDQSFGSALDPIGPTTTPANAFGAGTSIIPEILA